MASANDDGIRALLSKFAATYVREVSPQIKLLDTFLAYVLFVGFVQVVYCAVVGTFPFNSFLSGFIATVGVFVLTGKVASTSLTGTASC